MISRETLIEMLDYNSETGEFRWSISGLNRSDRHGKLAGNIYNGYLRIKIKGRMYMASHLAWLYVKGEWPTSLLDHKDRNGTNTRIENLREATHSQNRANSAPNMNREYKGITFTKNRWQASIKVDGKTRYLGRFEYKEDAAEAYKEAAKLYFGEFVCK